MEEIRSKFECSSGCENTILIKKNTVSYSQENLDEFLYELDSAYVRKSAAKSFDHLDIVFVDGDVNLLPWSPTAHQVLSIVIIG